MDLAVIIITVWILSVCFHEFGHALTAYWSGDTSVKDKGYLTLNPMVYLNSSTTLVIPLLALMLGGIPLPGAAVMITTSKIPSRLKLSLVSFAGPLFTLIFTVFLVVLMYALPMFKDALGGGRWYEVIDKSIATLIYFEIYVFILNMLPLPPLDGFGILEPWLPAPMKRFARQYANYGWLILLGLVFFFPPFSIGIQTVVVIATIILGVQPELIDSGFDALRANKYQLLALVVGAFVIRSRFKSNEEKAQALIKEHKFAEALPLWQAELAKNPGDARLLTAVATCLLSLERKEEALLNANKAIEAEPNNPQSLAIAAACLSDLGQAGRALELADRAITNDTNENFPFVHIVKATALSNLHRYQEALDSADLFLKHEKVPGEGLLLRASALENLGRYDDALATYNKAARSPLASSLHLLLAKGLLLCSMSKIEEGLDEFEKFLPKKPEERAPEIAKLKQLLNEKGAELDARGNQSMGDAARRASDQLK